MAGQTSTGAAYLAMLEARVKAAEERAALAEAKAASVGAVTVRVGQSGTICVYGLQRMPVSHHPSQWTRLLTDKTIADIRALITLEKADPKKWAKLVEDAKAASEEKRLAREAEVAAAAAAKS